MAAFRQLRFLTSKVNRIFKPIKRSYFLRSTEPFHPIPEREPKWTTAEEAVEVISSGNRVFIQGCAATPLDLIDAMLKHAKSSQLRDVELIHILTQGPAKYTDPEYEGIFQTNSLFIGANCRDAVNAGRADFVPAFLSDIPLLFRRNIIKLDVALVSVSPPDDHGFCTLGTSVDCTRAAVQCSKYIVAQVNPNMPRTFGDSVIHVSHLDFMVHIDKPLLEANLPEPNKAELKMGALIADHLVADGATLQIGIGNLPNAVLRNLTNHRDLGIHSEMFSDGVIDLVEKGAVTNAKKTVQTGKIVAGFTMGTKRLFDFMDNNPFIVMCDISMVNDTTIISQNPRVTAINSCLEVDITGQVVSDSIGKLMYSGVGGQIDFIRGAAQGLDGFGTPVLTMLSVTEKGESRIVPKIKTGAGVVTTRAHVHYIVTEYGIAYLFGKNLRQRAYELISVAHPDHREWLEKEAFERLHCMPAP